MWRNAICDGWIQHRRGEPAEFFKHPMGMLLLDVESFAEQCQKSRWFSEKSFAPVSLNKTDLIGKKPSNIKDEVLRSVHLQQPNVTADTVYVLYTPRISGHFFNPVLFYIGVSANKVQFILGRINNTPWDELHDYVLIPQADANPQGLCFRFDKTFHVSPFMPMDLVYEWRFVWRAESIGIHMQLERQNKPVFNANLRLRKSPLSPASMRRFAWQYAFYSMRSLLRIYAHAFKLYMKGVRFYAHPQRP